ncbi:MAG: TRAP transporter small permease [Lachnospiraceae bacterium]|nr:TRAP transporter small permease [Lachnospiraceae bacterium]
MSIVKWLDKNLELACMAVILAVMTVLSFANVIMRYCFGSALTWSDEVCCYCLAVSAFLSLPATIRLRRMIRVDTFTVLLSKNLQKWISMLCNVIILLFSILCVNGSRELIAVSLKTGQRSPALQIPVANFYMIMLVCFVLAIIRAAEVIFLDLSGKEEAK